jgi:hypothetical protein
MFVGTTPNAPPGEFHDPFTRPSCGYQAERPNIVMVFMNLT